MEAKPAYGINRGMERPRNKTTGGCPDLRDKATNVGSTRSQKDSTLSIADEAKWTALFALMEGGSELCWRVMLGDCFGWGKDCRQGF